MKRHLACKTTWLWLCLLMLTGFTSTADAAYQLSSKKAFGISVTSPDEVSSTHQIPSLRYHECGKFRDFGQSVVASVGPVQYDHKTKVYLTHQDWANAIKRATFFFTGLLLVGGLISLKE